ncbi:hypothetical protein D3C75_563110 [compost metagenome]
MLPLRLLPATVDIFPAGVLLLAVHHRIEQSIPHNAHEAQTAPSEPAHLAPEVPLFRVLHLYEAEPPDPAAVLIHRLAHVACRSLSGATRISPQTPADSFPVHQYLPCVYPKAPAS